MSFSVSRDVSAPQYYSRRVIENIIVRTFDRSAPNYVLVCRPQVSYDLVPT
jgi:hypothetical protein